MLPLPETSIHWIQKITILLLRNQTGMILFPIRYPRNIVYNEY